MSAEEARPRALHLQPERPAGRQLIQSYRVQGFTIAGVRYDGSVLVLPEQTLAWAVTAFEQVDLAALEPLLTTEPLPEILIIGAGGASMLVPPALRTSLRERGIGVESMETRAACRTYNVLVAEDRRVAAALIAL